MFFDCQAFLLREAMLRQAAAAGGGGGVRGGLGMEGERPRLEGGLEVCWDGSGRYIETHISSVWW